MAITNILQKLKTAFGYLLKITMLMLLWVIAYITLIIVTNGYLQGRIAVLETILVTILSSVFLLKRNWIKPGAQRYGLIFSGTLFFVFAIYSVVPVASNDSPKTAPDFAGIPTRYWDLKTGSHIAYYKISAKTGMVKKETPIIFLHGGPGAYVRQLDVNFFRKFADEGYDVYLYDQAGSGRSGLLTKASYSHTRNMRDFEAITQIVKARHYIVIGQSYGGSLLADLAADQRTTKRIYKAIYAEPGVTVSSEGQLYFAKSPNALTEDVSLPVRIFIGMLLNPKGNFTSQNEVVNYLSSHQDLVQKLFLQSFPRKDIGRIPEVEPNVINFSVIGVIPPEVARMNNDLKTRFKKFKIPSMLMLGESSYIERNAPMDLLRINPNIQRVQYLKNTGHILWNGLDDNNQRVKAAIDAFLDDKPPVIPNFPAQKDIPLFLRSGM
jgi:pimeloyl-ACP methyl ester carboxylesterase